MEIQESKSPDIRSLMYEKSNLETFNEFFDCMNILKDLQSQINIGKKYYFRLIYTQLRAIVTDSTQMNKGKINTLIFRISSMLNYKLEFYYLPDNDNAPVFDGQILSINNLPISINQRLKSQIIIQLDDYLKTTTFEYHNIKIEVSKLINDLANKFGGSHYPQEYPQYLKDTSNLQMFNLSVFDNYIYQFNELIIDLGLKMLKTKIDFELFFSFVVNKLSIDIVYLFDFQLPDTNCRLSLFFERRFLNILIQDYRGNSRIIQIEKLIDLDEILLINLTHYLSNDLKSIIEIHFEGELISQICLDNPLLFINEFQNYQKCFNRSVQVLQDFEFGLIDLKLYNLHFSDLRKYEMYKHYLEKKEFEYQFFTSKSFAQIMPNENIVETNGEVQIKTYSIDK